MRLITNNSPKIGRNDQCHCGSGQKYKKCCWESDMNQKTNQDTKVLPKNLNPMAMRMEMQAMMGQMGKIMQEKGMTIDEANKYFVGRSMDEIAEESRGFIRTPCEEAYDLALEAHSARTPKQSVLMAQRALEIDPDCAEAYIVLDNNLSTNPLMTINYMEKAIQAGEKKLGDQFFKDNTGHFWGILETRSYMRALHHLAQALWECRRQSEATEVCWKVLKLNPNDNQGIRYILIDFLLTDNRLKEVEKLIELYPREWSAHWNYATALYYFKTEGAKSEKTIQQAKKAIESNKFILQYLTAKSKIPSGDPSHYSPGSKEEAICYIQDSVTAWLGTPNALQWIAEQGEFTESKTKKKKTTRGKGH